MLVCFAVTLVEMWMLIRFCLFHARRYSEQQATAKKTKSSSSSRTPSTPAPTDLPKVNRKNSKKKGSFVVCLQKHNSV